MSENTDTDEPPPRATLYVKLLLGSLAFLSMLYFMNLQVTNPNVSVPYWWFVMLLGVMASLIGVDIIEQYAGGGP